VLTNKYAEGYPKGGGTAAVTTSTRSQQLAHRPRQELFGAEHPMSSPIPASGANMAVYSPS